jgi:hypothetical protein
VYSYVPPLLRERGKEKDKIFSKSNTTTPRGGRGCGGCPTIELYRPLSRKIVTLRLVLSQFSLFLLHKTI